MDRYYTVIRRTPLGQLRRPVVQFVLNGEHARACYDSDADYGESIPEAKMRAVPELAEALAAFESGHDPVLEGLEAAWANDQASEQRAKLVAV
jgi:hypothetical protein